MTPEQFGKWLEELMTDEKTALYCKKHSYASCKIPPNAVGCKDCWQAFYFYMIARTPPHLRAEKIELLIEVVKKAVELEESGKFDLELYDHPVIKVVPDIDNEYVEPILKERENK
jgi:hypothetical protein